jgi:hypothetical protein
MFIRLKNMINFDKFAINFAEVDSRPNYFHLLLFPFFWLKYGREGLRFITLFRALRLPCDSNLATKLPEIDLLILVHPKDTNMLEDVISSAIRNSRNSIKKITVVTPENGLKQISLKARQVGRLLKIGDISVLTDESLLGDELIATLLRDFPDRYGWIAQQLITVKVVLDSESAGVLQVDSDTVSLRPNSWLYEDGTQSLIVSTEFHLPYYVTIRRLLGLSRIPLESHIGHQMLFQPKLLSSSLKSLQINSVEELYFRFMDITTDFENQPSRFCAKYELYAYLIGTRFPNLFHKVKFSNVAIPRKKFLIEHQETLGYYANKYSSISAHSYIKDQ